MRNTQRELECGMDGPEPPQIRTLVVTYIRRLPPTQDFQPSCRPAQTGERNALNRELVGPGRNRGRTLYPLSGLLAVS